jgi:chemotaxis protein MotB
LSADRANAARRQLETFGVVDKRMQNVSGKADTDPKVKDDPFSPENRRISIVLLREQPAVPAAAAPAAPGSATQTPPAQPTDGQAAAAQAPAAQADQSQSAAAPQPAAEPQPPQSVTTP